MTTYLKEIRYLAWFSVMGILMHLSTWAGTLYVWQDSPTPMVPYNNWARAAHTIQDAVDAANPYDTVIVTNGVYATGVRWLKGTTSNRVAITKPILVISYNGPKGTIISGEPGSVPDAGTRCIYVGTNAVLSGFTLTNGHCAEFGVNGGGILCDTFGVVSNCVITGNSQVTTGGTGGGLSGGTAYNCRFISNSVPGGRGGGVSFSTLYNCTFTGNGGSGGGGAYQSTLYNCKLTGNSSGVRSGGGASRCTLYNCLLTGNDSYEGGGAEASTLYNCTVAGNSAGHTGGGVMDSTNYNCIVYNNTAPQGSNYYSSSSVYFNHSCTAPLPASGPGNISSDPDFVDFAGSDLHLRSTSPCIDAGSDLSALLTFDLEMRPRPLDGNGNGIATFDMGAYEYGNAPRIQSRPSSISVCQGDNATFSVEVSGTPPISFQWQFQGVNIKDGTQYTGTTTSNLTVLDAQTNDAGGYRVVVSNALDVVISSTANLTVAVLASITEHPANLVVTQGFAATFSVATLGEPLAYQWRFNGGAISGATQPLYTISNVQPGGAGYYDVVISNACGSLLSSAANLTVLSAWGPATRYVAQLNPTPIPPYTNWPTAATNIQDAIGVALAGDLVLVSNGVYGVGYRTSIDPGFNSLVTNIVLVDKSITVQSVNGAAVTRIAGAHGIRCAHLASNAVLNGFTLSNGNPGMEPVISGGGAWCDDSATLRNCVLTDNSAWSGGGVYGGTLYNCVLTGNSARWGGGARASILYNCTLGTNGAYMGGGADFCTVYNSFLYGNSVGDLGGGARGGTLYNCKLMGNSSPWGGGGASDAILYNCTVVSNSVVASEPGSTGGGLFGGTTYNCIVYYNSAYSANNCSTSTVVNYSCTTPLPLLGLGNITAGPAFLNLAAGDLRLSYGSPCIDTGTNLSAYLTNDLAGLPRPLDGDGDAIALYDMGAYEFDARTIVPLGWFLRYGLNPRDPFTLESNADGDGLNNFQEWIAETDPTNAFSCFTITKISNGPPVTVYFSGSSNRVYTLFSSRRLLEDGSRWPPVAGQVDIRGNEGLSWLRDTNSQPPRFYRVGVKVP